MDLSHPLEQISERGLLPKCPFPGPVDLPLVSGAFYLRRCQTPWPAPRWEFILRAVVVYVVVLGMVRLSGKRPLGQITPFDVLLVVLLGNAVQNALLGTDTSLGGGLLLAATLILLNYGVGWVSTRSRRIERLVEGEPVVIARDGRLFDAVLRREQVTRADFEAAMRPQGGLGVKDV